MRLTIITFIATFFFVSIVKASAQESSSSGRYGIDLGEIVITASKLEQVYKYATQNISIVSDDDIEASGITEVTEILELLPSVDILEFGSSGSVRSVHTRGAASTQVLTLIDGRPVNTPRDGVTDFNRISLSNIERIEVLRGPASNIYGANAVGGVINIITKSGSEIPETGLLYKYGSFATNLASFTHGRKVNSVDYFLAYDYATSGGHRDNSDSLSHNGNLKVGYEFNPDNRLSLSSGYYNSEAGSPSQVSFPDLDDRLYAFNQYFDLTYTGTLIAGQELLLKAYQNCDRFEFTESFSPLDQDTHDTTLYGIETQVSQTLFDRFRTAVGYDHKIYRLDSSTSAKHSYFANGAYFESEVDVFKEDNFFLTNGALKGGVRWDDYSHFGDRLSPSASFSAWVLDTVKLHALCAKSFRAPTFNDLYWPREEWFWMGFSLGGAEGNPRLGPEEAVSYEAGISTYLFQRFKTDVTFFKTEFEDLIEWTVDGAGWWRPNNVSSATIKGVELETELVKKENFKANLNYTYLEALDSETDKWLIYRPRHLYKLRCAYAPFEKIELGMHFIWKTKRFTDSANTQILGHDYLINLNGSYQLNDWMKLLFEVKNVLNRSYEEERGFSMPSRAFYGGVKIEF